MNDVAADYFDGRRALARAVRIRVEEGSLHIRGDDFTCSLPLSHVSWPERTRHGPGIVRLRDGGELHCRDGPSWDALAGAAGVRDTAVVRAQQSWMWVAAALLVLVLLGGVGYRFGVPLVARAVLSFVPESVDRNLGQAALDALLHRGWLTPSSVSEAEQRRLRTAFAAALDRVDGATATPRYEVRFHKSQIGANAFALPGGVIVLTDEMVALVEGSHDILVGVLAHELGHVRHRHGLRLLTQSALLGAATSLLWGDLGDFATLLAGVPALLGHLGYSREFERAADREALRVLRGSGVPPQVMLVLFERLSQQRGAAQRLPISLASHPADAERMRLFANGS